MSRTNQTSFMFILVKKYSAKTYRHKNVSSPKGLNDKTSTLKSRRNMLRNALTHSKNYFWDKSFDRPMVLLESIRWNESFSNKRLTCLRPLEATLLLLLHAKISVVSHCLRRYRNGATTTAWLPAGDQEAKICQRRMQSEVSPYTFQFSWRHQRPGD